MNRLAISAVLFSALHVLAACAVDPSDEGDRAEEETTGTTSGPMKWKPLPDDWKDCEVNGLKCRCSGDVIDCRAATGDGGTKAMTFTYAATTTTTMTVAP